MRIEGEKGVKTQSAPKHWPRTRKSDFGRAILILADRYGRAGKNKPCSAGSLHCATETVRATRTNRERFRPRSAEIFVSERTDRAGRSGKHTIGLGRNLSAKQNLADQIARPRQIHRPSAQNFSRPRYTMAKTKGNESMKKKNPFMQPPKKQIKLGSSSSNARAETTSPHSIDAIKNSDGESKRGEDDWHL
ncbi:unnamed protein product [Microthlaspi erraticum]|uniref:Uncharacterized protein n=1 Tax=Microthlaspi erraticum TaxID=1685480 RepID=A0A6D2HHG4_9BRAS|nr:unnamed protein product [Microthlaspi erraticum]